MVEITNIDQLIINKMTQAQYDELRANGQINENEIYLTEDYIATTTTPGSVILATEQDMINGNDESKVPSVKVVTDYVKDACDSIDLSGFATKEELGTKADKATSLEGYGITDITNINTTNVLEKDGKSISNLTINENEVIITSENLNIEGGEYIDVITQPRGTLYEHIFPEILQAQLDGVSYNNNIYLMTNEFEETGLSLNEIMDFVDVSNQSELYYAKLPDNIVPLLVPVLRQDKTQMSYYECYTDRLYQMYGLTEFTDENKIAFISSLTSNMVDPLTPLYVFKASATANEAEPYSSGKN